MPHMRVEPMKEFQNLADRMKKFVDEFPESFSVEFGSAFEPRVDVMTVADRLILQVELPGMSREQVRLMIVDDTLVISGEKGQPSQDSTVTIHRSERCYGRFERRVTLPVAIDRSTISATMTNGVLEVGMKLALPKADSEISITIE